MTYLFCNLLFLCKHSGHLSIPTRLDLAHSASAAQHSIEKGWSLIYSNCLLVVDCGPTGFLLQRTSCTYGSLHL